MSARTTKVRLEVGPGNVEVTIAAKTPEAGSGSNSQDADSQGWEVVSEPPQENLELVVATGPPPLHLLRRGRLQKLEGWSPEARIQRAFNLGKEDTQAALDCAFQTANDRFPLRSSVYVVLYDPTGDWPRYTRSLEKFYAAVKIPCRGQAPSRHAAWRPGGQQRIPFHCGSRSLFGRRPMPLAERGVLNLKVVNGQGRPVDQLCFRWPAAGGRWYLALPVRTCSAGVILAVPKEALSDEELEEGMEADYAALLGPNHVIRCSLGNDGEVVGEVEIILVEFTMAIRLQLELRTPRGRRVLIGFGDDVHQLPNLEELNDQVLSWLETGALRNEDFQTAVEMEAPEAEEAGADNELLEQFKELQKMMDRRLRVMEGQIQAIQKVDETPPPKRTTKPPADGCGLGKSGVRQDEIGAAIAAAREAVPARPGRYLDEPGKTGLTAVDGITVPDMQMDPGLSSGASVDDLMKLQMLKMMKELSQPKSKKQKKLPGLASWEDSDSSQEDTTWSSSSRGGRGIEAVERVRVAMRNHPEAYQERMEQRMMRSVDMAEMSATVPHLFIKGTPVGKSKTAGYCLHGFAEVLRLLLENKPKQARLHVLRMMAALEQFLIDESWTVASRITCTEEPPWGHWATQDVQAIRKQLVYNRLSESTWMGALINQLKEEEWLTKKRVAVQGVKGGGKGRGKDKEKEKEGDT